MTSPLPWGWRRQPCRHKSLCTWTRSKELRWMAPAPLACRTPAGLTPGPSPPPFWLVSWQVHCCSPESDQQSLASGGVKCRPAIPQGFSGWKPAKEGLEALHRGACISTYVKRAIVWGKLSCIGDFGISGRFCKNSKKQVGAQRHNPHLLSAYYVVSFLSDFLKPLSCGILRTLAD